MAELLALADDETTQLWSSLTLHYTETQGLPALRQAIAQRLYASVAPEQLVVAAPQELVYLCMQALLSPGDRVVCTFPGYQSLYDVAASQVCDVAMWELGSDGDGAPRFDLAAAEKLITPGTRLVVVNSPHNPSGAHFSRAEWARLCALCEAAGAYLFSDEMYRWLELDPGADRLPAAADSLQRGISLCGMSKAAGGPGLRIGWLACKDAALVSRILELKDFTSICNSAPSEVLALIGVRSWDSIVDRQLSVLRANLDALDAFFARWPAVFEWRRPVAGTVAFPRLLTGEPVEAWCQELVQQAGVLLMPATVYDHPRSQQEGRFRLGYGRRNLPQCLAALEAWLQQRYPQAAAQPEHA
ncbi:classes I and II [Micractinium conductrix]|uniref:Classes I and II n=1 Tax=Micractinium conductrix TaxID=554055 RepID=A0A2P6VRJ9_9CHLO|nr:classes I and II [Micractinium conductrix]|eukprot:PSC76719.1 classes I and II [Micractinium conductrix]